MFGAVDESDFTDIVSMRVGFVVSEVDANTCACYVAKGCVASFSRDSTRCFDLYGQGGLTRASRRHNSLNLRGLEVRDLGSTRPDGQPWGFTHARTTGCGHRGC